MNRPRLLVEELETRILYSADAAALLGLVGASGAAEIREYARDEQTAVASAQLRDQLDSRRELVFIDSRVPDALSLADQLVARRGGAQFEIVVLQADQDGLSQISRVLAGENGLAAIHILSHGSDGEIELGNARLDGGRLARDAEAVARWGQALADGGDLLLYGCEVAQNDAGRAFVQRLALLTGADVAASSNLTGGSELGGDWVLEYRTGSIESGGLLQPLLQQLVRGTLAITTDTANSSATATTGNSLSFSHTVGTGVNRLLLVEIATADNEPVTSVSWGSSSLTLLSAITSANNKVRAEVWYLVAPASGTDTISVTMGASKRFTVGATSFANVNQSTPLGTPVQGSGIGGTPSLVVASASGELVVDAVALRDRTSASADASQAGLWTNTTGATNADAYGGASSEPGAASVTMSWSSAGAGAGDWAAIAVAIKPTLPPTIATTGTALAYTENQPATAVDSGLLLSDTDSSTLAGATVSISANYINGEDSLGFTDQNGISGVWDAATGVLTLSGSSSLANYQAALQSVTYVNSSDDPSTANRTVSFTASDGALTSIAATRQISVTAVNDAPVVTTSGGALAYTENQAATVIDGGITVSDLDNATLDSATVTISANYANGQDVLGFVNQNGISGVWDAATGVMTLSGTSSVANYQAALQSVTYFNGSDDPSALARTISFVVNDGALDSAAATRAVTVTPVNDAPIVTTSGGALAYTENQAATVIDGGITVSDLDNTTLDSATVTISTNYANGQDVLGFVNQNGISGVWDAATGVMTLSGTSSVANYQAALQSVTYFNGSDDTSTLARTISFVVNDGALNSAAATRAVTVTPVNDAPVVTTSGGALAYTENQAATAIDGGLTVSDLDNLDLAGATVSISANYANGQDILGFTNQNNISSSWNPATGVLTLSGSSSVANYQAALRSVTYFNSSDDPNALARTISFVVNDGALDSAAATRTVTVTPVNDAPVITTSGGALAYIENQAATAVDSGLLLSDPDSSTLTGATVSISANYANGQDILGFATQNGISGAWNAATGVMTLSGTSSVANYQAALQSITYFNTSDDPSTATRTLSFTANDGALTSAVATRQVTVAAVNDAPVVTTSGGALAYTENQAATAIDDGITVSDLDNTTLDSATVTISANYANGQDVLGFVNQNNINGSWNAATGVLTLSGSSSLANYQTALRSVTYFNSSDDPTTLARTITFVVNDGAVNSNVATKTVTVASVNDPPQATNLSAAQNYTEDTPLALTPIVISDPDNANVSATLTLSNPAAGSLNSGTSGLVTSSYNAVTGVWFASGAIADVNALLGALVFTPSLDFNAGFAISTSVSDGIAPAITGSKAMTGTPVNDAPVLTTSTTSLAYPIGTPAIPIDPNLIIADVDSTQLAGATVEINGGYVNGRDMLAFANQPTITGMWTAATGVLTLSGSATLAQYQAALRSVTFQTSVTTSGPRLISFTATDSAGAQSIASSRTVSVGQEVPALWISTNGNATTSAGTGKLSFSDAQIARLSNPNLNLGAGTSNGTFTSVFDLDSFTADGNSNINGLHRVHAPVTVGTVNPVALQRGDILLTVASNETLGGIAASSKDIVLFRPTTAGDYSTGTFSILLRNPGNTGDNMRDFALVEAPMTIGSVALQPGDFLLAPAGGAYTKDIQWFRPTTMSTPSTGGTMSVLIDGDGSSGINFSQKVFGLELVQHDIVFGGVSLNRGSLLITVDGDDSVGVNRLPVKASDIFVLDVTATGNLTSSGVARMLLRGANVGLDSGGSEEYDALALVNVYNTAPVLDATRTPVMAAINEDAGAPVGAVGTLVSTLVDFATPAGQVDNIADPDTDAQLGLAVIAVNSSNGSWWYSIDDGASWLDINNGGAVSSTSARLLAADAGTRLYFRPNANFAGTISDAVIFRAWDRMTGVNGGRENTSGNGGSTAFSAAIDGIDQTITVVNDAPVRTAGSTIPPTVNEDAHNVTAVSLGFGGLAYGPGGGADETGQTLSYRIATIPSHVTLWLTDGTTQVLANTALSLAQLQGLKYKTVADASGSGNLVWTVQDNGGVSDGGVDTLAETLAITVNPVNDAPVLTGSNDVHGINQNEMASGGTLVADLIAGFVSDVDAGAVSGIAVTAVNNSNGSWHYSRDGGGSWFAFGNPGVTTARLLAADPSTYVRFVPNPNWVGTVSTGLTFRAWDQTDGSTAGGVANVSVNGGTSAFSSATASASLTVHAYPILFTGSYLEDFASLGTSGTQMVAGYRSMLISGSNSVHTAASPITTASIASATPGSQTLKVWKSGDPNHLSQTQLANAGSIGNVNDRTLATGPTSNTASVIELAMRNATGGPLARVTVGYDMKVLANGTGSPSTEAGELPGYSFFYSLTGGTAASEWIAVPALATTSTALGSVSSVSTTLTFATPLASGATMYFRWADDNGDISPDQNFAIDNVSVQRVNVAPVLAGIEATPLGYTENAPATPVTASLIVSDIDDINLNGATVTVTANLAAGQDVLSFVDQNGISGAWNAATGVLTLSGSSSVANYQAALRSVSYLNSSDDPSTLPRTVSFTVRDAGATSSPVSRTINVVAVNDAPVVTTSGGATAYIENQAATPVDGAIAVADLDNTSLAGATVTISGNYAAGQDLLVFANQNGISGSWNAGGGVLTLTGSSSVANYQAALRSVGYSNSSDDPSGLTRTISFVVNDGALNSALASKQVTVTPVNDAPVVATSAGALSYTENQAATVIDGGLTVIDLDNANLVGATVAISGNFAAGQDVLDFTNQNGISGSWNAGTGVLTLSGLSTVANYQAALRSVSYFNSSDDPSALTRTISVTVNDGALSSAAATRAITVTPVNDAPVVTTSGGTLAYIENQAATAIDGSLSVVDLDNANLAGATVAISGNHVAGEDLLGFTNQNGISGSWNAATGVLTLSGTSSVANYQTALRSVSYFNSSDNPNTLARTVRFVVNDGALDSIAATRTVTVTAVNDAPLLTGSNHLDAINRNPASNGGTLVADLIAGHASDPDSPTLGIAVTGVVNANGSWQYSTNAGASWTAFGNPAAAAARLLLADAATFVRFVPNADWSGTVSGGLTFRAWEASAGLAGTTADASTNGGTTAFSAATASASITVTAANTAPILSGANNFSAINEDTVGNAGTLVSALIAGRVTDADPGALAGIAVTAVDDSNGSWQYSLNGGSTWAAFGSPSTSAARLLAADANTRVRFVPNPDWVGSVGNGITFRAWDQSSGIAGGTANVAVNQTVLDRFDTIGYSNNDGSSAWSSNWIDVDANATGGSIRITGGQLQIKTNNNTDSIHRGANLSGASSATLSFNYSSDLNLGAGGRVDLRVSSNSGASYTTIASFTDSLRTGSGIFSADISAYASAGTRIRFETVGISSGETLLVDDLQIAYGASGGAGSAISAAAASSSITVLPVNDAPIRTAGNPPAITVDEDSANGSAVSLGLGSLAYGPGGGSDEAGQLLSYRIGTIPSFITLWQADGSTQVLAGASLSLAQLQGLTYKTVADANGSGLLSWTVQDNGGTTNGGVDTLSESLAITVVPVNDAPVLTASGGSLAYVENQAATPVDAGLTVVDIDNTSLAGATVSISVNYAAGQDQLVFANQNGISGSWNAATGVLTLSGSSSVANYQTALRSVGYFNSSDDPSGQARTVSFSVDDGALSSTPVLRTITVTPVNDAPVVTTTGGALVYTENQAATAVDSGLTIVDVDNLTLAGATVAISANYAAGEDQLLFTNQNGISGVWNAATGILTLSGTSSVANYQAALRSVAYLNSSDDPSALARSVAFTVDDGALDSAVAIRTITVTPVNDAPVVATSGGVIAYTENDAATVIDSALTVVDVDNPNLAGATIAISTNFAAGQDQLLFTNQNGISGVWNAATGVLSLSGSSSVANYQAALRTVSYLNSSNDPSTLPRMVSFIVDDGGTSSAAATRNISITAVNDAPVVVPSGGALTHVENQPATAVDAGLSVVDVDNLDLVGATVAISANYVAGEDQLVFTNQNGINGVWNAATGVLTLSGSSSVANYQAALRSVSYVNGSDDPSALTRTLTFVVSDGALSSAAATRDIAVMPVNDAPVVTTSVGAVTYIENDGATGVDSGLTVADLDNVNLVGATVAISGKYAAGEDRLVFADQNGISGVWNAATGVLTLSGSSSVANYQSALRSVAYANNSDDPSGLTRTVSFVVDDGALSSAVATRAITVTPVNDAPVVTTSAGVLAYVENDAATVIDSGLTVADLDNVHLVGATVAISGNYAAGEDRLVFADQNGISGVWNAATGVLTLSGTSSVANYQAALRSVAYLNSSDDPSALARSVSFTVNDGALDSAVATRSITVTPVNDAPVVVTSVGALVFTENDGATGVDSGLTVADLDNVNLVGATVAISGNYAAGEDRLVFADQNGISGVWNAATGVLTLSGSSSVANYQSALRSVAYANNSDDPSGLTRTVSFVVDDGALSSAVASREITVTPVNDAPVVTTSAGVLAYVENDAATVIDSGLTVADLDNVNLVGATVAISGNYAAGEDRLVFADQNGISGAWNATTGVLTLSGTSSVANYQAALRSVAYLNSSDDPSALARSVSFTVNDGALNSAVATRSITVTPVNDAPVVVTSVGALVFTENDGATGVDSGLTVADLDNVNLVGATVAISGNYAAGEDRLVFADQNGISGVWNAATGVLTLSGSSSVANYQSALRSVSYANNSDDPSGLTRTVSFVVDDGALSSAVATRAITVTPVNDAPVVTTSAGVLAYVENDAATVIDAGLVIVDVDNLDLVGATVAISANHAAGEDQLVFTNQNGISGAWNAATGVLTLSGTSSVANYQAALRSVSYLNSSDDPSGLTRTVTFVVDDGALNSAAATRTITVTPVNDAPVASNLDAAEIYTEDAPLKLVAIVISDLDDTTVTASLSLSNPAAGTLNTATIGAVTSSYDAATGVWSASGAVADVNALLANLVFTPSADLNADFSIATRISDGVAAAVTGSKVFTGIALNDAPTTSHVTLADIAEDSGPRLITQAALLANASDIDGPSLTAINLTITAGLGTLIDNGDGSWIYNPALNDDTSVSFGYTVTDGSLSVDGTATLAITPVNDAPTTSPVRLAPIAEDSGPRLITQAELLANAADVDGPSLIAVNLVITSGHGTLVDNGDGSWTYTPALNDDTEVVFGYLVTDGSLSAAENASLDITPVNDAPTNTPVTLAPIAEDSGPRLITQVELLANAADVDGPRLSAINLTISAGFGTLVDNSDGTWTFRPAPDDDTSVTFGYTVTDGSLSVAGSAWLDITPVDDAPVASLAPTLLQGGGSMRVDGRLLQASDIDSAAETLSFAVIDVSHGRFELASAPGASILQFSLGDVQAGRIVFVSTSAGEAPSFTIAPFDGNGYGDPIVASIDFRRSLLSTNRSIGEGEEQVVAPLQAIAPPDGRVGLHAGIDRETGTQLVSNEAAPTGGRNLRMLAAPQAIVIAEAMQPEQTQQSAGTVTSKSVTTLQLRASRFDNPEFYTRVSADDYVARLDDFQLIDLLQLIGSTSSGEAEHFEPGPQAPAEQTGSGLTLSDAARASAVALTAGTVWWALRAGSLLTGLLVSLPTWRHADLLAVLPDEDDEDSWDQAEDKEAARDEQAVDLLFETDAQRGPR